MKELVINSHTLENFDNRLNFDLANDIYEMNENYELKIMYGYETRPDGFEFIKPILVINNKYFLPIRIFEKDGIEYYKVLSILYETQYFSSLNLNFGLHTKLKSIRFNVISFKDVYFDKTYKYKDIFIPFESKDWILETTDKEGEKVINVSIKNRKNKVLEKYDLPLNIKTFTNKIIKLI